ncbi:hypothetical protein GCM10010521_51400 [Streptomyces rameus]|uniref:Uncharacterized protein n=2 Tax=Streptomyces rameus TaxID=68261 RepID=A0ABP6NTD0_9ACTN
MASRGTRPGSRASRQRVLAALYGGGPVDDHQAVGEGVGRVQAVGDQVQAGRRLVREQRPRAVGEGRRDVEPAAPSARERAGPVVRETGEVRLPGRFPGPCDRLGPGQAVHPPRGDQFLPDGDPRVGPAGLGDTAADPASSSTGRPAWPAGWPSWVRGRPDGEPAAAAVLHEPREDVEAVSPRVGLFPGHAAFMKVVEEAPVLRSRVWAVTQEVQADLARAPREETRAAGGDELPDLMAGQIGWVHGTVMAVIGREMVKGREPGEVSREVLALLDGIEDLPGERVRHYAVRWRPERAGPGSWDVNRRASARHCRSGRRRRRRRSPAGPAGARAAKSVK